MKISNEQRKQAALSVNEKIYALYNSDTLTQSIKNISATYSIDNHLVFVQTIGDVILGFYKIADLPRLLQKEVGLSADESQKITAEFIELLGPVIKREEEESLEKKNDITKLAEAFKTPEKNDEAVANTASPSLEKVEPLRTMKKDVSRIHGYGSLLENQDDEPVIKALDQDSTLGKNS